MSIGKSFLWALIVAGCRHAAASADAAGAVDGRGVAVDAVVPPGLACPTSRATSDAPDDSPLPQVRVLYVLPSDGPDERLDTNDRICTSIRSVDGWLRGQAGGAGLRFDTTGGRLDVGFVRLDQSDAVLRGTGGTDLETGYAYLRDRIERALRASGALQTQKLYAVYYGGSSPYACGGGAWPPSLPGQVAALYLGGTPPGAVPCKSNPLGAALARPGYLDYAILHELFHTMGLVARGAPSEHSAGHVMDRDVAPAQAARDLMYAGRTTADPGWATNDPAGLLLDIGHDDYFGHGRNDLADLARSPFLDR